MTLAASDLRAGQSEVLAQGLGQRAPDGWVARTLRVLAKHATRRFRRRVFIGSLAAAHACMVVLAPDVTAKMSARCTSRNVVRWTIAARPRPRPRAASARGRARSSSSSRICSRSSLCPSRSAHAFSASPSTPIVSGCRVQRSGVAIERYWWIRARASAARRSCCPRGAVGSSGGSPSAIRFALPASMPRSCVLVEAGEHRRAQRDQERARLLAVGVVRGVEDLLGRDEVVEVEQVDRAPDGGVEEDARLAAEVRQPARRGRRCRRGR